MRLIKINRFVNVGVFFDTFLEDVIRISFVNCLQDLKIELAILSVETIVTSIDGQCTANRLYCTRTKKILN